MMIIKIIIVTMKKRNHIIGNMLNLEKWKLRVIL